MRYNVSGNDALAGRPGGKHAGRRGTTTTTSAMPQGGKRHEHERAGLSVLERSVALLDDHRLRDSGLRGNAR